MKKIAAISLLLLLSVLLFVSSAAVRRSNAAVASADLTVTKVDTPDPVTTGSALTYTITITNNGPDPAADASWTDTLPAGTTFVSLSGGEGWSCTVPEPGDVGTVSCSNPSFAVGSAVFTFTVAVAPTVPAGSTLSNTATVSSSTPDGNSENQSSTATTTVLSPANVTGTKSRSGGSTPGSNLSYLIILSNSSGSDQQDNPGNEFTDVLPADLTLVAANASGGTATANIGTNTVTWNGVVPAGDTISITIDATIKAGTEDHTISNQGTISYDADGDGTNEASRLTNVDSFSVGVSAGNADLGVTKLAADEVLANTDVTYTITVTNGGPDAAANATLNDPLPGNLTFVSLFAPAGWSCTTPAVGSTGTVFCTNPSLQLTNGQTFTLVVHVQSETQVGTVYSNKATVSTTSSDANSENDESTASTKVVTCFTSLAVTTNADSGPGSLRQAIVNICSGGTIGFDMNQVISPISLSSGQITIDKNLTIQGPGANLLTVQNAAAASTTSRVFNVNSGVTATISGLTISGGNLSSGFGGGILYGTNSTVTVTDSTISGNSASGGAGISNSSGGTLTVTNSTISGNPAGNLGGGGIFSGSGVLNVTNSTISGNSATDGGGGGIANGGTGTVTNSTISNNSTSGGAGGGGIRNVGTLNSRNSIIAGNTATGGAPDFFGTLTSQGHNLIGNTSGMSGTVASDITNVNPGLGPLANNGGPTQTMALLPGSPALNAGDNCVLDDTCTPALGFSLTTDQRGAGFSRAVENVDIGAFEQQLVSIIRFSSSSYNTTEGSGFATITVERIGDLSQAVSVDYSTPDDSSATTVLPCSTANGIASSRCDFETALGTLRFAAGDGTAKTFTVLINQDSFVEGPETLTLTLSNLTGGAVFPQPGATTQTATLTIIDDVTEPATNPIDDTETFVRQQYRDFLNREPDAEGLAFWKDNIDKCNDPARRPAGITVAQCIEFFRVQTSTAFFLSIEFQNTGYYVERTYKTGFGDISPPTVPVPVRFTNFLRDTQEIGAGVVVGSGNWETQLDNNKSAFALSFVQRAGFLSRYPGSTTATDFVDSLNTNAGNVLSDSERSALISELTPDPADPALRASVLRKVTDNATLQQREFNRAFVLIEYFGYLRRNPDAAPDMNFNGYNFWLDKLNQFGGNFVIAEMVRAFISSDEYRQRFGP
jgi:uncharacterized repeat protein (TIGR01451 family)